eukprot:2213913-Amphidinium_carterae.2
MQSAQLQTSAVLSVRQCFDLLLGYTFCCASIVLIVRSVFFAVPIDFINFNGSIVGEEERVPLKAEKKINEFVFEGSKEH